MGNDAPTPPDPKATAAAQTGTNISTAIAQQRLNNINQRTPWGSLNYRQTGTTQFTNPHDGTVYEIPQFSAEQTLSPEQQQVFDGQMRAKGALANLAGDQAIRLGGLLNRPLNTDGLPGNPDTPQAGPALRTQYDDAGPIRDTYGDDYRAERQRVEDAMFARLGQSLGDDRQALQTRLANQGIALGSNAYASAMDTHNRAVNDARSAAIINAGTEHSRLANLEANRARFENSAQAQQYSQNAGRAVFENTALQQMAQTEAALRAEQRSDRQRQLQERLALRSQPLNEIIGLLHGGQVRTPNFITPRTPNLPTVDYAGLVNSNYNQRLQAHQAGQSSFNDIMGGIMGLGSSFLLSDRRMKENIRKVGRTDDGQEIYSFRYKTGGPIRLGLIAQDVEKKKPEAVKTTDDGIKLVDYGIALRK